MRKTVATFGRRPAWSAQTRRREAGFAIPTAKRCEYGVATGGFVGLQPNAALVDTLVTAEAAGMDRAVVASMPMASIRSFLLDVARPLAASVDCIGILSQIMGNGRSTEHIDHSE
jgi:hypothetical protein